MTDNLPPYDYVIVGAGTAGCVLANRLSADPDARVLLLEAGGKDDYFWIDIPVGYLYTIGNPRTDWCYKTEPEPGLNGRSLGYARGRGAGRLLVDQRDDLHARPEERLRSLGGARQPGLVVGRGAARTSSAPRTTSTARTSSTAPAASCASRSGA